MDGVAVIKGVRAAVVVAVAAVATAALVGTAEMASETICQARLARSRAFEAGPAEAERIFAPKHPAAMRAETDERAAAHEREAADAASEEATDKAEGGTCRLVATLLTSSAVLAFPKSLAKRKKGAVTAAKDRSSEAETDSDGVL